MMNVYNLARGTWLLLCLLMLQCFWLSPAQALSAEQGQLDAFSWDPRKQPLPLDGGWAIDWKQLQPGDLWKQPDSPWFDMPSTWDRSGSAGWNYPGQGYASYTLQIVNLPGRYEYAIFIPEIATAFRLFANGRLIAEGGHVADNAAAAQAYAGNRLAVLGAADNGQLRLLLQVSNFHHHTGGPWQSLSIGPRDQMVSDYYAAMVYEALIASLMVVMAVLLILEYAADRRDLTGLWLGLFALALGIRTGISGYAPFYWLSAAELPWEWHMRLTYISMMISPVLFLSWVQACFPWDLSRRMVQVVSVPFVVSVVLCALLPAFYFTQLLGLFSILLLLVVLAGYWVVIVALVRRRQGAPLVLLGMSALGVAVIHDVLLNNQLLDSGPWLNLGLLVFILAQTSNFLRLRVLQRRQIEFLSQELSAANQELERRVELRTRDLADKAQALERANNQLQVLANVDSLTGLLNRRAFIEQMKQLSELPVKVALLWIDIDHFKRVNDTFGHAAGDEVLSQFGAMIRRIGRDQDRCGRLGGEEFALLLLDCDEQGAEHYARRLQAAMQTLHFAQWPELSGVTASIGIAVGRLGEDSWESLIHNADEAMYQVKRNGRNGFRFS